MKKLIAKDKKLRKLIVENEYKHFTLKSIINNLNFFTLIRWNADLNLKNLAQNAFKVSTINRCLYTFNKKRFNKFTGFSRHVFLKRIREGHVMGIKKSSW